MRASRLAPFCALVATLAATVLAVFLVLIAAYLWWLQGVRIDRELTASTWPLISTNVTLACITAVLVYLVATVGAAVIALSGVILIAYSRLQRDLPQAERHARPRDRPPPTPKRSATASYGSSSTSSTPATT